MNDGSELKPDAAWFYQMRSAIKTLPRGIMEILVAVNRNFINYNLSYAMSRKEQFIRFQTSICLSPVSSFLFLCV